MNLHKNIGSVCVYAFGYMYNTYVRVCTCIYIYTVYVIVVTQACISGKARMPRVTANM